MADMERNFKWQAKLVADFWAFGRLPSFERNFKTVRTDFMGVKNVVNNNVSNAV